MSNREKLHELLGEYKALLDILAITDAASPPPDKLRAIRITKSLHLHLSIETYRHFGYGHSVSTKFDLLPKHERLMVDAALESLRKRAKEIEDGYPELFQADCPKCEKVKEAIQ